MLETGQILVRILIISRCNNGSFSIFYQSLPSHRSLSACRCGCNIQWVIFKHSGIYIPSISCEIVLGWLPQDLIDGWWQQAITWTSVGRDYMHHMPIYIYIIYISYIYCTLTYLCRTANGRYLGQRRIDRTSVERGLIEQENLACKTDKHCQCFEATTLLVTFELNSILLNINVVKHPISWELCTCFSYML